MLTYVRWINFNSFNAKRFLNFVMSVLFLKHPKSSCSTGEDQNWTTKFKDYFTIEKYLIDSTKRCVIVVIKRRNTNVYSYRRNGSGSEDRYVELFDSTRST